VPEHVEESFPSNPKYCKSISQTASVDRHFGKSPVDRDSDPTLTFERRRPVVHTALIRWRKGGSYALVATSMLLTVLGSVKGQEVPASETRVHRQPVSSDPLVIQGRITTMQGALVTVKTPDGYPGGPGIHAQFVIAGPTFKVDVSRARVLLPDGKQPDKLPLAVGDHVLMVLGEPSERPEPSSPGNINRTYFASIIERIAATDKIITH
jgi:hypothetical protein